MVLALKVKSLLKDDPSVASVSLLPECPQRTLGDEGTPDYSDIYKAHFSEPLFFVQASVFYMLA